MPTIGAYEHNKPIGLGQQISFHLEQHFVLHVLQGIEYELNPVLPQSYNFTVANLCST
jgi:hypothetical protein